jgi:hypothetical protein
MGATYDMRTTCDLELVPRSRDWFEECRALHRGYFCIGGVSMQVVYGRGCDVMFGRGIEPFRVEPGVPDLDIRLRWVAELNPTSGRVLFDSETTWRLHECDAGFQFDFGDPIGSGQTYKRLLLDHRFRKGTLLMSVAYYSSFSTADPFSYPLDELLIMHRLTQEKAIELHGCGIVRADGTGNLFVGHSGAGKSTTTRLWTELEDVEVLSDDRIIVRRDEGGRAGIEVETPFQSPGGADRNGVLRLRDSSASRTSHFAQDDKERKQIPPSSLCSRGRNDSGMRMYGTPWHGEGMYASPGSAPLARVFILEHGHGNVLTRLSPSQAVAELFARSFVPFHRHEYVDAALDFLQELVGAVPCYHYAFEPTEAAVERIRGFRD